MAAFRNYQLKQMKVLSRRMLSPVMERCMLSVIRSLLLLLKEVGNNAVFLELTMLALRLQGGTTRHFLSCALRTVLGVNRAR